MLLTNRCIDNLIDGIVDFFESIDLSECPEIPVDMPVLGPKDKAIMDIVNQRISEKMKERNNERIKQTVLLHCLN